MNLKASSKRVQEALNPFNLSLKVIEFSELTRTSEEAAKAIGCEVGQIAKTLIFKGKISGRAICVIASGKNRVDEKKIVQWIGEALEKPDALFVLEKTGFAIGGVPPLGYELDCKPFIDEDLMQYAEIWAAAGTPNSVFCLSPENLVQITKGQIADVKKNAEFS